MTKICCSCFCLQVLSYLTMTNNFIVYLRSMQAPTMPSNDTNHCDLKKNQFVHLPFKLYLPLDLCFPFLNRQIYWIEIGHWKKNHDCRKKYLLMGDWNFLSYKANYGTWSLKIPKWEMYTLMTLEKDVFRKTWKRKTHLISLTIP